MWSCLSQHSCGHPHSHFPTGQQCLLSQLQQLPGPCAVAASYPTGNINGLILSMAVCVITCVACGHTLLGIPGAHSHCKYCSQYTNFNPPLAKVGPLLARVAPFPPPSQDMRLEHSCGASNSSLSSSFSHFAYAAGGEAEHHTPQWGCPGVHLHPSQDGGPGPHV